MIDTRNLIAFRQYTAPKEDYRISKIKSDISLT